MPLYEFSCIACNARREINIKMEDRDAAEILCDACDSEMIRVLSSPGIQFKGGGFYSTGG